MDTFFMASVRGFKQLKDIITVGESLFSAQLFSMPRHFHIAAAPTSTFDTREKNAA